MPVTRYDPVLKSNHHHSALHLRVEGVNVKPPLEEVRKHLCGVQLDVVN